MNENLRYIQKTVREGDKKHYPKGYYEMLSKLEFKTRISNLEGPNRAFRRKQSK